MHESGGVKRFLANVPIPEPIIAAILVGLGLRHVAPVAPVTASRAARRSGASLVLAGAALIVWSTVKARQIQIAEPERLLTGGPYRLSRNPMYVGWTAIAVGLGLLLHSPWLLLASGAGFLYLHGVEIPQEEQALLQMFGDRYRAYRARVRRYL